MSSQDACLSVTEYLAVPIGSSQKQIRLLTLEAAERGDGVVCTLKSVLLKDDMDFKALSYAWHNPGSGLSKLITLGDMEAYRIGDNLYRALQDLRTPHKARRLWIDALCINQSDDAEKGQQVQLMGNVYRSAERVVIWLGTGVLRSPSEQSRYDTLLAMLESNTEKGKELWMLRLQASVRSVSKMWWRRIWV